jgi:hypothetical protein
MALASESYYSSRPRVKHRTPARRASEEWSRSPGFKRNGGELREQTLSLAGASG